MLERISRARRRAHVSLRLRAGRSAAARRVASYAGVLLASTALAAMLLPERDATAQILPERAPPAREQLAQAPGVYTARVPRGAPREYRNRNLAQTMTTYSELLQDAARKCDLAAYNRLLGVLRAMLRPNGDIGRPEFAAGEGRDIFTYGGDDANRAFDYKRVSDFAGFFDRERGGLFAHCAARFRDRSFIFDSAVLPQSAADRVKDARAAVAAAEAAVKRCDRDAYTDVIADLRAKAQALRNEAAKNAGAPQPTATTLAEARAMDAWAQQMIALANDMAARYEELFRNCRPPRTQAPPPPPKVEAPPPRTDPTPPGGPQRPVSLPQAPLFVFEPWFAVSIRNNDASGAYTNDAGFPPGSGKGDKQQGNVCGGADFMVPFSLLAEALRRGQESGDLGPIAFGSTDIGLRFGICELGSGEKVVFSEVRHGADGAVTLSERERTEIQLLFLLQQNFFIDFGGFFGPSNTARGEQYASTDLAQTPGMRARNWWPFAVYFGVGPSFVRTEITMTSNQAPGGGVLQSASEKRWDTGLSFVFGGKTAVCRNCIFGNPLMFGVEGQWTTLPARNVGITSSTFGFVEQGRVSSRSASKVTFRLTVPFGIGR